MKKIRLTKGYEAIVDDEDFDRLNQFKWCAAEKEPGRVYAYRMSKRTYPYERRHPIRMHREILDCPEDMQVDHINHVTLDNRKVNLRVCNKYENMRNRKLQSNNTHGSPGLTKIKDRWRVTIRTGSKWPQYIGTFSNKEDAAKAYKEASLKYHGEFSPYA